MKDTIKKYLGQIVFNVVTAAVGVAAFGSASLGLASSPLASILAVIVLMSVLSGGNYYFVKRAESGKKAFQKSYIITEQTFDNLVQPQDYIDVMKDLKDYPLCRNEAQKVLDQWELFKKKSGTLDAISSSGGVYDVVNQDVESVMLRNMTLFMKRAAIMQSAADKNEIGTHKEYLKKITQSNDKILSDYTQLLIEASQLTGEDTNKAEIESLNILIDSIRNYRNSLEKGDQQ